MSDLTPSNALQQLLDLEIITSDQRDLALGHARAAELETLTNISEVLFWLITRDIFPEEDFMQFVQTEAQSAWLGTEKDRQRLPIISATHAMLQQLKKGMNLNTLEQLFSDQLITKPQHELAQANVSEDEVFGTPEQALAWMIMMGFITQQELDLLRTNLHSDSAFAGNPSKIQTLTAAEDLVKTIETAIHKANVRAFWGEVFPGPGWMWIGGTILAVAGFIWYVLTPTEPPSCSSSEVQKSLDTMMLMQSIETNTRNPLRALREEGSSNYVAVRNIETVGYAKVDKIRGCLATLKSKDDEAPYAFTIGPKREANGTVSKPEEFMIIGANPEIVKARFGHLTAEGNYAHQAQPIGRSNLEKAFRTGFDRLSPQSPDNRNALALALGQLQKKESSFTQTDANRQREIAEIEPVGECKPLEVGKRYLCPLMIERNNPVLAATMGDGNSILQGSFTFELKNNEWQITDNFGKEFVSASGNNSVDKDMEPAASAVTE